MAEQRVFESAAYLKPQVNDAEPPIRSLMASSKDSNVIIWHVATGQRLSPHVHPLGQDTWIVQSGAGDYVFDAQGSTRPIKSGDVVVAHAGEVHGVLCTSTEPLVIISVVAPAEAGFEPVDTA
jgi:quercetin dioxygenase-like cupin family protein